MNSKLPKPLQEALARSGRTEAGEAHPSADTLTAFAEYSLPQSESQRVTVHLAQCADCREVLFLSGSAVERPIGAERELVTTAAASQVPRDAFTAAAIGAGQVRPGKSAIATPRRSRWRLWWVWAPAVAVVLIVAGIVAERGSESSPANRMTMAVKAPLPAPAASQPSSVAAPASESESQVTLAYKVAPQQPKLVPKSAGARSGGKRLAEGAPSIASNPTTQGESPAVSASAARPASPPVPDLDALAGAVKSAPAAVPTYNSFAESERQTTGAMGFTAQPNMGRPQTAIHSVSGHAAWRITTDGHLEHLTVPGSWTPALADQPITFHVVSVVGNNVWAGGNNGALFHSRDGGETWNKQPLGSETGTIVSIQFGDAEHGVVTTDAGGRWSTSDGGVSWVK